MKIHIITQKLLSDLDKFNIHIPPSCLKFNKMNILSHQSKQILTHVLENIEIFHLKHTQIKHSFQSPSNKQNITIELLQQNKLPTKTSPFYNFVKNLKSNKLSKKEIYSFINFHNRELYGYLMTLQIPKKLEKVLKWYPENILSNFVPLNVQDDIIRNLSHKNTYTSTFKTNKIDITIYSRTREIDVFQKVILFTKAFFLFELLQLKNQYIPIYLFYSKETKKLPPNNNHIKKTTRSSRQGKFSVASLKFLGPQEINSGLTMVPFLETMPPTIVIFRQEEIEKVLLHELVHATKHDQHLVKIDQIDTDVKCAFNVPKSTTINFGEACTETTALIVNSLFNSLLRKIPIQLILKNEIRFSILQCSKIMNFFKINNINSFFCNNCCFLNGNNSKWNEKTSVLSYFFMKTSNLLNLEYFLGHFWVDKPIKMKKAIDAKFVFNFIKKTFHKYKKLFLINQVKTIKNKTLRMTLYDFDWTIE